MSPMLPESARRLLRCLVLVLPIVLCGAALAAQSQIVAFPTPALPTTADTVSIAVLPTCLEVLDPTRVGQTITLVSGLPVDPFFPCPVAGLFSLGTLPEGSYTLEQRDFSGTLFASRVFQVTAPSTHLNLLGGRFAVTASWTDPGGSHAVHTASAVQFSDESGYFWFFDPRNVELSVKVLDGTSINHHFWVFISSMTNVAYTVTVEDTAPGCPIFTTNCPTKTYTSKQGTNRNFIDLGSFSAP